MNQDLLYLKETFVLARKAEGRTSPNPLVGAVIVKNNKVISKGYHKAAGRAHAEIEAMRSAKSSIVGSTLYINLEPCCHHGRTPPCVDEVIKRGIKRVVIATADPNPKVSGRSIKRLKKAKIKVDLGLCKDEAKVLNEVFFKNTKTKMPFVVTKVAQSLDGKIATQTGMSKWITSASSRKLAKGLRDKYDCVLIGANTLIKDNPQLKGLKNIPYKVIVSSRLDFSSKLYLLRQNLDKLIIFTSEKNRKIAKKISPKIRIIFLKESNGQLPIKKILKILYTLNIMSVFVEGGSKTLGLFFDAQLVDKTYFFIAPKIFGGKFALSSIGAKGISRPQQAISLERVECQQIGRDFLICGYPRYK